jgi:GAF domain-containing protein
MTRDAFDAAAAAGALGSEGGHRALLQSVVDVARAIFGAEAASVLLLDDETDELVFEAISGTGQEELVGMRFPSSTGIAGWVVVTGQPLVVDDLAADPRFARATAEQTGYVPHALVAVPLVVDERVIGVLEVLDRPTDRPFGLSDMNLLTQFAHQAALALDLLRSARRTQEALIGDASTSVVARLATLVERADDDGDALALLEALERVLRRRT